MLERLLDALARGPKGLTAIRGVEDGIPGHVIDSVVAMTVPQIACCRSLADIGAGSGFPGLALAVMCPTAAVTLVESAQKKARWLTETAAALTPNVRVCALRSEELAHTAAESFEVVVARALAPPPVALELCAPLAAVGGHVVLWVGPEDLELEPRIGLAAEQLGLAPCTPVAVEPFVGARRRLMPFHKAARTPGRFPRRPGRASSHPLA